MISETILNVESGIQLEAFFDHAESSIRIYLSDSKNTSDVYSIQYIDLDITDTEYLINKLNQLKKEFKQQR
jgi:hypothetical protein